MELRHYQKTCISNVEEALKRGINRQLCVCPTGGGKTIFSAYLPERIKPSRVLFLAHREELIDQAYDTFALKYPSLSIGKEIASNRATSQDSIVIASVSSIGGSRIGRLKECFPDPLDKSILVITDEAHHSCAETYKSIYEYFGLYPSSKTSNIHIGITATPFRGDGQKMSDVFQEITFVQKIGDLILEGFLCDIKAYKIETETDLAGIKMSSGDYSPSMLSERINTDNRNEQIIKAYKEYGKGSKAVIFCADLDHARSINAMCNQYGLKSGFVCGATPKEERRDIIDRFRSGDLRILTNVSVLTEGFDVPDIGCIIMARPTRSPVLYSQIIGRGLRPHASKEHVILIDFYDRTELPSVHSDSIFNAPTEKCGYKEWKKIKDFIAPLFPNFTPDSVAEALDVSTLDDVVLKVSSVDILDLMSKIYEQREDSFSKKNSKLYWKKISDGSYNISSAGVGNISIRENALGEWEIWHRKPYEQWDLLYTGDAKECFKRGEKIVGDNNKTTLYKRNASWRDSRPTESQIALIKRLSYKTTIPDSITNRGQATFIIDELIRQKNDSGRRPGRVRKSTKRERVNRRKI